ncbi:MAG: ABC transporter ATP-binding protein [Clostridia bacterium]|nr:ABC transporter ATP-binding protein [Clostridia bacterium]
MAQYTGKYMIQTRGVSRAFPVSGRNKFWALKDVNVDVPAGALTILKGRSGSGKTTLMNLLGALDKPTKGKILFAGKNIVKMNEKQRTLLRRREIGFVFQSVALIPMMNAQENVEYALRLARFKGNRTERALNCLKLVGLEKRAKHMPEELSGGEQQRVAIARAIAHRPKLIFADEPTGELDTDTALRVVKIFKDLIREEGVTIVMTTHDTGLMEVGDQVYELKDGEIVYDGE